MQEGILNDEVILVLEDEPLIALDICAALEEEGAEVLQAASVEAALETLDQRDVTAAVVDILIGGETGRSVARRLKKEAVPFLYYSGRTADDFTTRSSAPIVSKPAGGKEIASMLRLLLDGKL